MHVSVTPRNTLLHIDLSYTHSNPVTVYITGRCKYTVGRTSVSPKGKET